MEGLVQKAKETVSSLQKRVFGADWVAKLAWMKIGAIAFVACSFFWNSLLASDPSRNILSWKTYTISEPNTRLSRLAHKAGGDRFNNTELCMLIADKNNLGKAYDLSVGNKILLPVYKNQ